MTSGINKIADLAITLERFPDFPPRDDMQNSLHLDDDAHQAALRQHLGNYDTTIVLSEIPVRWTPSQAAGHRIPDLLVAFGVDREQAVAQNGYSIRDLGKPPDFVLEVASVRTADNDVVGKRVDYANFGIPEYWRFDPTGGERHGAPIGGDRLVDGTYQPVELVEIGPGHLHGHSDVLGLDPCWHDGQLRWYDPAAGQHLMTFREESEARIAAEMQASAEYDARIAAERRVSAEHDARIAAEARVRELEEKLKVQGENQ